MDNGWCRGSLVEWKYDDNGQRHRSYCMLGAIAAAGYRSGKPYNSWNEYISRAVIAVSNAAGIVSYNDQNCRNKEEAIEMLGKMADWIDDNYDEE